MNNNKIILILVHLLLFKGLTYLIKNCGNQNLMVSFLEEINYKI